MSIFEGKKKERKTKPRFTQDTRIVNNPRTKIPDRVMEINAFPKILKGGTVAVTQNNVETTFKSFLKENKALFGVVTEDLKLASAKQIHGKWYVKYQQQYKGIPVYNATVGLDAAENGKVSSYASKYYPDIDLPTTPKVPLEKAVETAKATYDRAVATKLKETEATLLIYPEKTAQSMIYHLAWKFMLAEAQLDPELEKYFVVDALNGKIITSYKARFPGFRVDGRVQGEVYQVNPTDAVSTQPYRNQYVDIEDAGQVTTDNSGNFSKLVSLWWVVNIFDAKDCTFKLNGPYAHVQNSNGSEYEERRRCTINNPCNLTWTAADRDHLNVFYHMNLLHDWLRDELGYSWVNHWDGSERFNARVNYNFANAYAGSPMQFGTNNFARSSDVVYHECTHNVLCAIYDGYIGWPDANAESYAMDEGFADYFACSFTNDSRQGEGCGAPRDLNNNRKYPGKNSYNIEGHTGGMIISGAAWSLRQRLITRLGVIGARVADRLILEAHQILSTYPRDYYFSDPHESNLLLALYKAADDNNNLQDSFPYFTDIHNAFYDHDLLQAVLNNRDSFDFSTNITGTLTGGDLYYSGGKFWANNVGQRGVKDLGNIGDVDLDSVAYSSSGYTRFGVNAVVGHTYLSLAQNGEGSNFIVFRVQSIGAGNSTVTIKYLYRTRFVLVNGYILDLKKQISGMNIIGDLQFSEGKFYGKDKDQMGLIDLGDLKAKPLEEVKIPTRGFVRDGIPVVNGHTYVSLFKQGEKTRRVVFTVEAVEEKQISINVLSKDNI